MLSLFLTCQTIGETGQFLARGAVWEVNRSGRHLEAGTSEENKAGVQGSIAYFGTYAVSEIGKVIRYHIEERVRSQTGGR